jgi:hypothetical protein
MGDECRRPTALSSNRRFAMLFPTNNAVGQRPPRLPRAAYRLGTVLIPSHLSLFAGRSVLSPLYVLSIDFALGGPHV